MYYPSKVREFISGPPLVILILILSAISMGLLYDLLTCFGRKTLGQQNNCCDVTNKMGDKKRSSDDHGTVRDTIRIEKKKLKDLKKDISALKEFVHQLQER